uniref:ABC transmembrane type-1 domain-containing protein n=1 Tax=Glossina brevipalpis TaxID=37001 RepID=A0A1A9WND2_9MUSC
MEFIYLFLPKFAVKLTLYGTVNYRNIFNYAAQDQILRLRGKFLRSVPHQDMSWFDFNQSGEVASHMNEDLTKMGDGLGEKNIKKLKIANEFLSKVEEHVENLSLDKNLIFYQREMTGEGKAISGFGVGEGEVNGRVVYQDNFSS